MQLFNLSHEIVNVMLIKKVVLKHYITGVLGGIFIRVSVHDVFVDVGT